MRPDVVAVKVTTERISEAGLWVSGYSPSGWSQDKFGDIPIESIVNGALSQARVQAQRADRRGVIIQAKYSTVLGYAPETALEEILAEMENNR